MPSLAQELAGLAHVQIDNAQQRREGGQQRTRHHVPVVENAAEPSRNTTTIRAKDRPRFMVGSGEGEKLRS